MIRSLRCACVVGVLSAALSSHPALAIKQFETEFKAVYVKEGTPLAAEVANAKCNV